jgi:P4 family phage/plasmid primase-like protien
MVARKSHSDKSKARRGGNGRRLPPFRSKLIVGGTGVRKPPAEQSPPAEQRGVSPRLLASWLRLFHPEPNPVIEMRLLKIKGESVYPFNVGGYFDAAHFVGAAVRALDRKTAEGAYFTLNPLRNGVEARCPNKTKRAEAGGLTGKDDVAKRQWLMIDADPKRPAGISATKGERAKALADIQELRAYLKGQGWPEPIVASSGNGFHLYYRIDLPADDGGLVERVLRELSQRFSTAETKIDPTTHKPNQLTKLYGTYARKGEDTADRPHWRSHLVEVPGCASVWDVSTADVKVVTKEQLEAVGGAASKARVGSSRNGPRQDHRLKVREYLQHRGVTVHAEKPGSGGVVWLVVCPFNPDHGTKKGDTVVGQKADGMTFFKCNHPDCDGKRWQEFKAAVGKPLPDHYDPPLADRTRKRREGVGGDVGVGDERGRSATLGDEDADDEADAGRLKRTDQGNAERLVIRHGKDMRYCHETGKWYVWDEKRWAPDRTGEAMRRAKDTVRGLFAEAADPGTPLDQLEGLTKFALKSQGATALRDMLILGQSEPGIPVLIADRDRDPWLLNCPNGTIDLRTGELRRPQREDYLTTLCPVEYDPRARCPTFLKSLDKILAGNVGLITYLHRALGCGLTGVMREQFLPILCGDGGNGKTTIANAVMATLGGDYAIKASRDMLLASKDDKHPAQLARLLAKRIVFAVETPDGARLDETMVKELTGGDPIVARGMRQNPFQFDPTHTTFLVTNHRPRIRGTDEGIWRRVRLILFTVTIPEAEQDKELPEKLAAERQGVLAWLVEGCLDWQRQGLKTPPEVTAATAEYRRAEDVCGAFIEERCRKHPKASTSCADLYGAYKTWAEENGEEVQTPKALGRALSERGFEPTRTGVRRGWKGLVLLADHEVFGE